MWLDNFDPNVVTKNGDYRRQLDQLAGRGELTVRVRRGNSYVVCADTIRTVVTANEQPPGDEGFQRRYFVVAATVAMYGMKMEAKSSAGKSSRQSNIIRDEGGLSFTQAGDSRGSKLAKCAAD